MCNQMGDDIKCLECPSYNLCSRNRVELIPTCYYCEHRSKSPVEQPCIGCRGLYVTKECNFERRI